MTNPARLGLRRPIVLALGLLSALFLPSLFAQGPGQTPNRATDSASEFFEKEVRPLLVEKCQSCHGSMKSKGGLKLTSRAELLKGGDNGPAIQTDRPGESLLLKAVHFQEEPRMPPQGKLTDRQIEILDRWVKEGAFWPGTVPPTSSKAEGFVITAKQKQFWSFQPIRDSQPPPIHNEKRAASPIDRFLLARLESAGIAPAPLADKRTLLRRATFDLIGLPPSPEETDAFLADESPRAFEKVVDRLLSSPAYGERWGRHWLDLVRYADARDLIQLPPESDFREAWRYRDWVVDAFNRDLPYREFLRYQIAGDLLPPTALGGINKDGLVATGMLAIADFVPGDTDKNQMIADYVNDQVDVVSRSVLGLSLACCRCHDHKFDPLSADDYYALAGIFFSSRIIPGPVAGNTPLVRAPLLQPADLARIEMQTKQDAKRRQELETQIPRALDRAYRDHLTQELAKHSAPNLVAAANARQKAKAGIKESGPTPPGIDARVLAGWIALLDRAEKNPSSDGPPLVREIAQGKRTGPELTRAAQTVQEILASQVRRVQDEAARSPQKTARDAGRILALRADDPALTTDAQKRVLLWPNQTGLSGDAIPSGNTPGPVLSSTKIGSQVRSVLSFDGQSLLAAPGAVPATGSLFLVYRLAATARAGERLVGWEDADKGKHGLGLMTDPAGKLHAVLRKNGQSGDIVDANKPKSEWETIELTWGREGTQLVRGGVALPMNKGVDGLSTDPAITALKIGGPGSGTAPWFRGEIAEIRVYDRALGEEDRKQVARELEETWFQPAAPQAVNKDILAVWFEELRSPRGPFWPGDQERTNRLPLSVKTQLTALNTELVSLKNKPAVEIPKAVVIQEGGPKGSRHEGFQDAQIFVRGDPKRLGKTVPRGFPQILNPGKDPKIGSGSGRLELADWVTRPENPLTARVMVNRIWQHHFGEGLVRTPSDFGERGDRPNHPELLDYLAKRFIDSGWSIKTMHRQIMLSAAYRQSSRGGSGGMADPENRFWGRANVRRLDAESIRDSLLMVSGRLDRAMGGPPISDIQAPRRTLYLMSARTGANTSDFGRLFDRADPGSMVAQRDRSTVAPQALFFLNDPFVQSIAKSLSERLVREGGSDPEKRIQRLYRLTLGRPPRQVELELGKQLTAPAGVAAEGVDPWERYCQLLVSTNEFLCIP